MGLDWPIIVMNLRLKVWTLYCRMQRDQADQSPLRTSVLKSGLETANGNVHFGRISKIFHLKKFSFPPCFRCCFSTLCVCWGGGTQVCVDTCKVCDEPVTLIFFSHHFLNRKLMEILSHFYAAPTSDVVGIWTKKKKTKDVSLASKNVVFFCFRNEQGKKIINRKWLNWNVRLPIPQFDEPFSKNAK